MVNNHKFIAEIKKRQIAGGDNLLKSKKEENHQHHQLRKLGYILCVFHFSIVNPEFSIWCEKKFRVKVKEGRSLVFISGTCRHCSFNR